MNSTGRNINMEKLTIKIVVLGTRYVFCEYKCVAG